MWGKLWNLARKTKGQRYRNELDCHGNIFRVRFILHKFSTNQTILHAVVDAPFTNWSFSERRNKLGLLLSRCPSHSQICKLMYSFTNFLYFLSIFHKFFLFSVKIIFHICRKIFPIVSFDGLNICIYFISCSLPFFILYYCFNNLLIILLFCCSIFDVIHARRLSQAGPSSKMSMKSQK